MGKENETTKLSDIKLSKEVLKDILNQKEDSRVESLFPSEEEFKLLENPNFDLKEYRRKKEQGENEELIEAYRNLLDILKKYLDLNEEYYNIVSLWIIGTYFHQDFPSYPYLFLNAMKGSGKTRTLTLITHLSKDGQVLNSLTEAILFRTTGTLGIDEFESLGRKGFENLRELLNSAYKKGIKVKRLKKVSQKGEEKQVVEEFDVYRPIVMANIWGMEGVLSDRCIHLILEKSDKRRIINLIEIFRQEEIVIKTKELLNRCRLCVYVGLNNVYREWNNYVTNTYTTYTTHTTHTYYTTYTQLFETLKSSGISGRDLELAFPLLLIATSISDGILKRTCTTLKNLFEAKKEEEFSENRDISLIDFVSQRLDESSFDSVHKLTNEFKAFIQSNEEWITPEWMGRALKRLNLVLQKRRISRGVEVILNIRKAQNKIKMFK